MRWAPVPGLGWGRVPKLHGMQGVRPGCLRTLGRAIGYRLVATHGQVIATSEAYESKASAINGIESVKRNAPTAEIDDQTDK